MADQLIPSIPGDDEPTALERAAAPDWDRAAGLRELPSGWVAHREDMHRLAYAVVARARHESTGRFGLRATAGGFGTPEFDGRLFRVDGTELVVDSASGQQRSAITTLAAAGEAIGVAPSMEPAAEHDSPELGALDRPLAIDAAAARALADWYAFSWHLLAELRATDGYRDVGITQLWPGHFDPAVEIGSADDGQRATFGASPGDHSIDEPYLYVGAWGEVDAAEPFWNAPAFNGAILRYAELTASPSSFAAGLAFLRTGASLLGS